MINLLLDLNNLAHRSLFTLSGYGSKQFSFDSQDEIHQFIRKLSTDISYIIRNSNPSRVIIARDDSSWRKGIKIDENEGYKGNRIKTSFINWNNVYNALDDFSDILENKGMIVTKISNAEADDILSLYAQELAINQKQHVIIVSGDEDIRQLVNQYNHNGQISFVTVFNPFLQGKNASRKLYVPNGFEAWLNEAEVVDFMRPVINIDKQDFKKIITADRTKMEIVDGKLIMLRKIFCGDDGDNIPAIYSWLNDKGAVIRITNSKFEKILEYLNSHINKISNRISIEDIINNKQIVIEAIKSITKQTLPDNMVDIIDRQIKLVVLDSKFFPINIVENFNEIKNGQIIRPRINYASTNMYNLLEGTKYVRERSGENESAIFKQIDRIKGSSLF